MKNIALRSLGLAVTALGLTLAACGRPESQETHANVNFVRTSASTASLETRDLEDTWIFGLNVIETKNFFTTALNLNFPPQVANLRLMRDGRDFKLVVMSEDGQQPYLVFDTKQIGRDRLDVDFATAGNRIEMYNGLGAAFMTRAETEVAPWQTAGQPRVVKIIQDADTVIADVEHTISYALDKKPDAGAQSRTGTVTIRIFLKRAAEGAGRGQAPTVGQSLTKNIGFFGARRGDSEASSPIARFKVDTQSRQPGQIVVHLKDFPSDMYGVGESAILAWNKAFGFDAITVKPATADLNIGDPRNHVVRWFDGLEQEVPWAGYAPTMVDPLTGHVLGAQILINGDTVRENRVAVNEFSKQVEAGFNGLRGKIGNVPVVQGAGETPVVTFMANPKLPTEEEVKKYYFGVIMHEFGHALGLRHNFAASTKLDADNSASSVMDYEPNWASANRSAPGTYDFAAVRWGYLGESPRAQLPFCTDEDISKRIDCNQGDMGDPADHTVAALLNGTAIMTRLPVALPVTGSLPMRGALATAFKIQRLQTQLPAARRQSVVAALTSALDGVRDAQPDATLSSSEQDIARGNLSLLKKSYDEVLKSLSDPNAFVSLD